MAREREAEDPFGHTRMTLGEHLQELRVRLFRGVLALAIAFAAAWFFQQKLLKVAIWPYERAMVMLEARSVDQAEALLAADETRARTDFFVTADPADKRLLGFDKRLVVIKPSESFVFILRICFYAALVVGGPIVLWQMWQFISAGLYPREKRVVFSYFPYSLLCFASGISFGYFLAVPYGMYFLNILVPIEVARPSITVDAFMGFMFTLCVAFGFVFQLPLVMTFLARTGLVTPASMSHYRGHFIVVAFIVAAVLTPPDPYTQCMMAVPLCVLYEVGIWTSRAIVRRHAQATEASVA